MEAFALKRDNQVIDQIKALVGNPKDEKEKVKEKEEEKERGKEERKLEFTIKRKPAAVRIIRQRMWRKKRHVPENEDFYAWMERDKNSTVFFTPAYIVECLRNGNSFFPYLDSQSVGTLQHLLTTHHDTLSRTTHQPHPTIPDRTILSRTVPHHKPPNRTILY